jgi:hypothetical protein
MVLLLEDRTMIINIRGSSCSGKSTNLYRLLSEYPSVEVWERVGWNKKKPRQVGHLLAGGLFIVGPYTSSAKTGGMDMLMPGKTELVTLWLERNCAIYPHVVFESMMASLAIGRYHELRRRLDQRLGVTNSITFAFLDTPLEVCRERIRTRNGGRGPTGKGINEEATVDHQWNRVRQIRTKLEEKGERCETLPWEASYETFLAMLMAGGWDPFSTPPPTHEKVRTRYTLEDVWNELHHGWPDNDEDRANRFRKEMAKHADKFPS